MDASNTAYCWGYNGYGQLGLGATTARSVPSRVATPAGVLFTYVETGYYHSCGLTTTGEAYCRGRSANGEIGGGTTVNKTYPVPVSTALVSSFSEIRTSYSTSCGLKSNDGAAYCWGI